MHSASIIEHLFMSGTESTKITKAEFSGVQILVREKALLTGVDDTKLLRCSTVQWLKGENLGAWRTAI